MDTFEFEAYQCFSRPSVQIDGPLRAQSKAENRFKWEVKFEIVPRDKSVAFAELFARSQSIGASQVVDPDLEHYLGQRWPVWLVARGRVSGSDLRSQNGAFWLARNILWLHRDSLPQDQIASHAGYRREFVRPEDRDIMGVSRPSQVRCDGPSDVGEPCGPGYVRIDGFHSPAEASELVWSEVLRLPERTTYDRDSVVIQAALEQRNRHFRIYSELRDSRRHLARGELKATVRSAAPAVEGALRHFMAEKKVRFPKTPKRIPFTEKIEEGLRLGGAPSFAQLEPEHARAIGNLYKARNSSHNVDCSYTDENGVLVRIRNTSELAGWVDSAHVFVHWIDTLV